MCIFCTAVPTVAVIGLSQKLRLDKEKYEALEQGLEPPTKKSPIDPSKAVVVATGAAITGLMAASVFVHSKS